MCVADFAFCCAAECGDTQADPPSAGCTRGWHHHAHTHHTHRHTHTHTQHQERVRVCLLQRWVVMLADDRPSRSGVEDGQHEHERGHEEPDVDLQMQPIELTHITAAATIRYNQQTQSFHTHTDTCTHTQSNTPLSPFLCLPALVYCPPLTCCTANRWRNALRPNRGGRRVARRSRRRRCRPSPVRCNDGCQPVATTAERLPTQTLHTRTRTYTHIHTDDPHSPLQMALIAATGCYRPGLEPLHSASRPAKRERERERERSQPGPAANNNNNNKTRHPMRHDGCSYHQ